MKDEKIKQDECNTHKSMREPTWAESGIEVKVEKLGNVVRNLERELEIMVKYVNQLIGHSHSEGKVVKELSHPNSIEQSFLD